MAVDGVVEDRSDALGAAEALVQGFAHLKLQSNAGSCLRGKA
jgi:hypothetical protein